eukprot:2211621-Prorocentrum_lima.AAC.1
MRRAMGDGVHVCAEVQVGVLLCMGKDGNGHASGWVGKRCRESKNCGAGHWRLCIVACVNDATCVAGTE